MLYIRSVLEIQRGSDNVVDVYNEPADAPIIPLAPFEFCDVEYKVYYHTFIMPQIARTNDARAKAVYIKQTAPRLAAIELLNSDWRQQNFEEGDEIALYGFTNITEPAADFAALHGKINKIVGSIATISIYSEVNIALLRLNFYAFVFLVEPERRGQPGIPAVNFHTLIKRYGDVASDSSPLSGLRYSEPHANAFLTLEEEHTILPYTTQDLPWTGIPDTQFNTDIIITVASFFMNWSALPAHKRAVTAFRLLRKKMRFANFFSYRSEYNTLARYAQRDLYHENAELITRVTLNSDEREITLPLRLRLMHANVDSGGVPAFNVVPSISVNASVLTSIMPSLPTNYSLKQAAFALTTDNNEHHLSTLIRHQHDLTRYTAAPAFTQPDGTRIATLPVSAISNDLRRNPFETYAVAIWHFNRITASSFEEIIALSDAIPLDTDENIQKIVTWLNNPTLDYHYHRFSDMVLGWNEDAQPEKGEYNVYIRIRKDADSPAYTAQQYTFKIDETTRVQQTSNTETFYALHYPHDAFLFPINNFVTANVDCTIIKTASQYEVFLSVPAPSFDQPVLRNPNVRPKTGALFHWFEALNSPIFNLTSGSNLNPKNIRAADGEMRIYILTPSGKIYATNWRQVRAQEPTENNNIHYVQINDTTNFVTVNFPNSAFQPALLKANVKLFQDNINTLRPVAESAYDPVTGAKTTYQLRIWPFFGFFGSRLFVISKLSLPPGRYKIHCIASYADTISGTPGYQGFVDDVDYEFEVGSPAADVTPIQRAECCYTPPLIQSELIPYVLFNDATNTYEAKDILITNPPNPQAWNDFTTAYNCCFKIYDNPAILRENFVDVTALFDNRINNIPASGKHWFRYRGFLQTDGYEITEESYVRSDLSEEPVLRQYRRKYILELFLSDCDIKQLEFQKLARRWIVHNYTNSLLPSSIEVLVKNIEQVAEYNKLKVTVSLTDFRPDEYRHK